MRIGICDDERTHIDTLCLYLRDAIENPFEIIAAEDGETLISLCKDKDMDLFFLDIEMEGISGIETGKILRKCYPDAVIVFITGHERFALDAFELRAYNYIIKPLTQERFDVFFKGIQKRLTEIFLRKRSHQTLRVQIKSQFLEFAYGEIVYFENSKHRIWIHTVKKEQYPFYGAFRDLRDTLDLEYFVQTHQAYIVNLDFVLSYGGDNLCLKREFGDIPVSKTYRKNVRMALSRRLFGSGRK